MSFSKLLSSALFAALLTGLCASSARAQKPAQKDNKTPLAPVTPAPSTPFSDVRRDNLLNGFQIITLERVSEPVLKCDVVLRAGAMFDLADKTGLATLTQATLMAVNPRVKEEFESLNAKLEWGVNWDLTWFHIESPPGSFDAVMEILSRLLIVENIRADAFKRAQQDTLDKLKTTQPTLAERADEAFLRALYGTHPYGHNLLGNLQTIASMKLGDLYDFHKRFYMGNDAFAVVTGPVKHERIMRTFKTFFGGWIKGAIVQPTFRAPARVEQLNFVKVEVAEAATVELRGGVLGARLTEGDYLAVELLARILAVRLKRAGVEGVTIHHPERVLAAPFYFAATVTADQAQAVSRQITEAFAALATTELTAEELANAKAALNAEYAAYPIELSLRDIEAFNLPKPWPLTLNTNIKELTAAELQRVAKRLLEANALTVVALGRVNELKSQL
ncbi:MAG: insulinase family protein [Acidobacteria bacterium]|nr:insulinase family protein [Acidobacteriota bacterium]MBI3423191.1 insulinase family protein [Acidobacteriota bacterium]